MNIALFSISAGWYFSVLPDGRHCNNIVYFTLFIQYGRNFFPTQPIIDLFHVYKLIHDPPCWCIGFTEIFELNHVMKKVYINQVRWDYFTSYTSDVAAVAECVGHRANLRDLFYIAEASTHSLEVPSYPVSKNFEVSTKLLRRYVTTDCRYTLHP